MAVKDKKDKKIVKPTIQKTAKAEESKEQTYFAKDLADKMNIGSFEFLLIKRETGLTDDSVVTMSEMQKKYNEIVRR